MNKVILSGQVLKEVIITCGNTNKSYCYLQNNCGNYLINIDNSLLKSIDNLAKVVVEGKLCYQKINSQNSHFWYVDAEKIVEKCENSYINCVKIDIDILHTTQFYDNCYLIFGQLSSDVESVVEIEYTGQMTDSKKLNIIGSLIPQQLDKNGFFEYIINAKTIKNISEKTEDNERLQM